MYKFIIYPIVATMLSLASSNCYSLETINKLNNVQENERAAILASHILNRLDSQDKTLLLFKFIDRELKQIVSNPALQTRETYEKMIKSLTRLTSYLKQEKETGPLDLSYKRNLQTFVDDISDIYPSVYEAPQAYTVPPTDGVDIQLKGEVIIIPNPFEIILSEELQDTFKNDSWLASRGNHMEFFKNLTGEPFIEDPYTDLEEDSSYLQMAEGLSDLNAIDEFIEKHSCGFIASVDGVYGQGSIPLSTWLENSSNIKEEIPLLVSLPAWDLSQLSENTTGNFIPEVIYIFSPLHLCTPVPADFRLAN